MIIKKAVPRNLKKKNNKTQWKPPPNGMILGLQQRDKAIELFQYNRTFSRRIEMKIEFSSQRREMLLFLTTNMAAVTSPADQQYMKITAQ